MRYSLKHLLKLDDKILLSTTCCLRYSDYAVVANYYAS